MIGFTGHQKLDHPERWDWVKAEFIRILQNQESGSGRVISSLAKGGDQLFSETALALGLSIEAILPCAGYESTFTNPEDLARYRAILAKADTVTILDFPSPTEDAYLAAGRCMVEKSTTIVALWNGKAAAGKGGTGDIVGYAKELSRPIIHVNPDAMQVVLVSL